MDDKYRPVDSFYGYDSEDEPNKKYGELNPLQLAAFDGELDQVKALVEKGDFNIDENNYERYCAVNLAALHSHWDVVDYLIEKKADLNNFTTPAFHLSPLYYAVAEPNADQVTKLLLCGARLNDVYTANHEHLLHVAVRGGDTEMVSTLLESKAIVSPQLPDGRKDTPLSLAVLLGRVDVVALLQKHGAKLPPQEDQDLKKGLYSFIQVSQDPKASFNAAFAMRNDEGKPFYEAEAVALGLYGCLRSRKPADDYIKMLLEYNTKHGFDAVNTPIPLTGSWVSLLVQFDENKVGICMGGSEDVNGEQTKKFTPYELAVIANKQNYLDLIKPFASEESIAAAAQYARELGY